MFDKKNPKSTGESPDTKTSSEAPRPAPQAPQAPAAPRNTAVIGSTVKVRGEILSEENLVVEGEVEGSISVTDNELVIGRSGRINADINAKVIRIDGEVEGDISGKEKVIISQSGNVRGNVVASRVALEDGARFKGNIDMGPDIGASAEQGASSQRKAPTTEAKSESNTPPDKNTPQSAS